MSQLWRITKYIYQVNYLSTMLSSLVLYLVFPVSATLYFYFATVQSQMQYFLCHHISEFTDYFNDVNRNQNTYVLL